MSNFDNPSMEGMAPEPVSLPESEPQVAQKAGRIARALSRLQRNNESSGVPVQYPVAPRHHEVLGYNEQGNELGLDYLNHLFPDETFSTLSSEGSSAVVYEDENSRVYKVMRDYTPYSYYEDEMAGLTLLHNEGLAPKPIIFIDAAEQFRLEREEGYAKHY